MNDMRGKKGGMMDFEKFALTIKHAEEE